MRSTHFLFALTMVLLCMSSSYSLKSQAFISILFGDELKSGKLGYGLNGGLNYSNLTGMEESKSVRKFYIGTYFDIRLGEKPAWFLHTGLRLKSDLGARNIGVYPIDGSCLDSVFSDGHIERSLKYFHLPALIRYKFQNHFFLEVGPMFGLLTRAKDEFFNNVNKDHDLLFKNIVTDNYKRFDAGLEAGIGYHLMRGKGMYFGARYYQGLMDVLKDNDSDPVLNQSLFLFVSVPIVAKEKAPPKKAGIETGK